MITIYTLTYNEELLIQFMIDHYRARFPGCHIVIYDNKSTDDTVKIALENNCEIRGYETNHSLNDGIHVNIKNSCWKDAKTNWVLVCDLDELLDINYLQLFNEQQKGVTIITSEAYSLVNMNDNYDIKSMNYGFRDPNYDKKILFNKTKISDINYLPGCHVCSPSGVINYSNKYRLYHYKYIHPDLFVNKNKTTCQRISLSNKKNKWGLHCFTPEDELRRYFEEYKFKSIKLF